jgi:hypothetical protein
MNLPYTNTIDGCIKSVDAFLNANANLINMNAFDASDNRRETYQQKAQRTFRERLDEEYALRYRQCRANGDRMGASFWFAMWFN